MTLPTVNLTRDACDERLRAALTDITEHPDHWDQAVWGVTDALPVTFSEVLNAGDWPCGTTCCLAGNIAIRERMVVGSPDPLLPGQTVLKITDEGQNLIAAEHTGVRWSAGQDDFTGLGAALLGMSRLRATDLFRSDHLLTDLWQLADVLTEHRVALPDTLTETVSAIDARVASFREEDDGTLNESPFGESWRQSF
jgi:hypothetical protein